jgi:2-polyprenyl-6-methoxyphenol hydroxylase-like FAD-dependent oxidoreductase
MRVLVVGRGVGGLCMASGLSRLPFINEIKVIGDDASSYLHGYTGLWSPALQALKYLMPQREFDILHSNIEFINNSGFFSLNGEMLAKPSTKPNLGFIKNSDLCNHIKLCTNNNVKIIHENETVTNVNCENNEVTCSSGKKYQADLIIGADGKLRHSIIIHFCFH